MAWGAAAAIVGFVVVAAACPVRLTGQITFLARSAAETRPWAERQLAALLAPTALEATVPSRGVAGPPKPTQNVGRSDDGRGPGVRSRFLRRGRVVDAAAGVFLAFARLGHSHPA